MVPAGAGSLATADWLGSLCNLTVLEVRADVESWPAKMTALSKLERLMVSIHSYKNSVIVGILKHRCDQIQPIRSRSGKHSGRLQATLQSIIHDPHGNSLQLLRVHAAVHLMWLVLEYLKCTLNVSLSAVPSQTCQAVR